MSSPPTARRSRDPPLPREVKVLGAVSFAQDTASEMIYPFLPTFITGVLGAPVVAVGVAEGCADAAAAGMKLIAGRLSRSDRRRRWIAAGYGLATVGKLIVATALVWTVVLLGRVIDRIGKGIRGVPRDALIADVSDDGNRGRAFGYHRSLDTLGAVVGPVLGLALYGLLDERIRPMLALAVIPALVSVALIGLLHDPPATPTSTRSSGRLHRSADGSSDRVALPHRFWRVMMPLGVFAVVNSTDALLLQRASELGLDLVEVVLAYVAYNLVYAVLAYPAGKAVDRVPHRYVYAGGLVVFAIVYLGLGLSDNATAVWLLLPAYGAYTALTDGVSRAWISDLVPKAERAWALGVHGAATGSGVLIAGLWSGLAWGGTGQLPLTISGVVAFAVALWLVASGPAVTAPR